MPDKEEMLAISEYMKPKVPWTETLLNLIGHQIYLEAKKELPHWKQSELDYFSADLKPAVVGFYVRFDYGSNSISWEVIPVYKTEDKNGTLSYATVENSEDGTQAEARAIDSKYFFHF